MRKRTTKGETNVRKRTAACAVAALLFATGCNSGPSSTIGADHEEALRALILDAEAVRGFYLAPAAVQVTAGEPAVSTTVYIDRDLADSSRDVRLPGPGVVGADFPLDEGLERARDLMGECEDDFERVNVTVLSESALLTEHSCGVSPDTYTTLVGDQPIALIDDPFSPESMATWLSELEVSGIGPDLHRVSIDLVGRTNVTAYFGDDGEGRSFVWSRELSTGRSNVFSFGSPEDGHLDLSELTAERLHEELEALLSSDDLSVDSVQRLDLTADPDGEGVRLRVMADGEYSTVIDG